MRSVFRILIIALGCLVLGITIHTIQAQNELTCPELVQQALTQLGDNCATLGRNSACYGHNQVKATFTQAVPDGYFSQPADRSDLINLRTIQTSPLDLPAAEWGMAVMNVQANVPDTLPGQAVTFLLLGDMEVENAVDPASVKTGPATAILQSPTDLRTIPASESAIITQLPAGTVLEIDETSTDGAWLHITTNIGGGWISRDAVNQTSAINALPVQGETRLSPMQAFYFRNGLGDLSCQEAPSVLAVQSPENITVDLTANGADIRLGSLVLLQVLPPGDTMQLTTIEGNAILDPDGPNPLSVPAGFTTTRCLDEAQDRGINGEADDQEIGTDCTWEPPRSLTLEEQGLGLIVQTAMEELGLRGQTPTTSPTPAVVECPSGTTIVHTVAPGENLYRIGLRYRTGMGAIMAANGLSNPQVIYAGQRLTIPCGVDTGLPSVPPENQPPFPVTIVPPVSGVDCSAFRATSPLDGLPYGSATFYWDAAPGATGYRVNIYNLDEANGALVGSFQSEGTSTNLTADVTIESIGYGFSFAWEVQALLNGQTVCTSNRHTIPRAPQPGGSPGGQPPAGGGFSATWTCSGAGSVAVSYSNAPAGDTSILISFIDGTAPINGTFSIPPASGTQIFNGVANVSGGTVLSMPSYTSVTLSPANLSC
jgi:LysM repeat protein